MTRSSGGGVFDFIARLAIDSSLSQSSILRLTRAEGFRIGNDIARALINSIRNTATPRQTNILRNNFLSLSVSVRPGARDTLTELARNIGREVGQEITRLLRQTMIRITYAVTGEVGFIWESGTSDNDSTTVTLERTVTVRADQIGNFNRQIPTLARALEQQIVDIGVNRLGLDPQYGDGIILDPPVTTTIVSAVPI